MAGRSVEGWAVVSDGGVINLKTVAETRRAAIVNWLCTAGGILVMRHHTDEQIEEMWKNRSSTDDVERVSVTLANFTLAR